MKLLRILALTAGVLLFAADTGTASTLVRLDLPQLVRQSDSIVQGRVVHVEAKWEQNLVFTYVYLDVEDPLKGERLTTIVIRQVGGTIGALNMDVNGMPKFATGQQVLVFLKAHRDRTFQVVGMNQGRYEVIDNYALSNVSGVNIYDPRSGRIATAAFSSRVSVESLKTRIRELLK